MAGNSKRTLTLDLRVDLDSKEAERNIESLGKEFLSLMSKMNKSGKGMNVFKDLVSYISRLDSEMTTFRREHADDFNRIFGDIDTTLLNQMQTIFGVTKEQLTEINALRDKIAAARKKPNTSVDEIKSMEKEVRDLYAAIGKSGESGISGRGKIETRFNRLEESLNNFARTWESVNDRVSKGFGSGSGGAGGELEGFSKEVQQEIDKIQNEIEELKKVKKQYEDTVKDLKSAKDNKGLVNEKKYGPETSVEGVQKLMDEYTALQQKIQSGSKDSVEYYQNLNRLAEVAIKLSNSKKAIGLDDNLKKQFEDISADNKNYPNKYVELLSYQSDKLNSVRNTVGKADIKNIDNFIKAKQEEIKVIKQANDVSKQPQTQGTAYDELIAKVKEYKNIVDQINNAKSSKQKNSLSEQKEDLEMDIADLSKLGDKAEEVENILNKINGGQVDEKGIISELCNTLGIDFPASIQKTKDANKELEISYDELNDKIQEYTRLWKKSSDGIKTDDDGEDIDDKISKFDEFFVSLSKTKEGIEEVKRILGDLSFGDITSSEGLEQLSKVLNIDSTKQLDSVMSKFKTITAEANRTGEAVQKVMYHVGNLFSNRGARDTFGDMPDNLTTLPEGTRWEKYGFGVLGGGLFGVGNPSTISKPVKGTEVIQSIDLSKYNMYIADTEERATSLMTFLSKLQKFSMKSALPDYTGFDAQLKDVDISSLYDEFKSVFDQSEMTKNEFSGFINEMSSLLKEAGLKFDAQTNSLEFSSLGALENTDNISTRFMKKLGYQGVNVAGTSFDDMGQGSVLFDFNASDIVGYFNTIEQAVKDYKNIASQIDGQEWVGTSQQLEEYKRNLDEIIARVKEYRKISEARGVNSSKLESIDGILSKFEQIRNNVDDVLSGKKLTSSNLSDTQFTNITENGGIRIREIKSAEQAADAHRDNANAIKEEAAAKDKLDSTIQGDDAADDIARENGKLEEKLELLREIADAYGSNITNAKRNRYEDLNQKDINDGLTSREEDRFSELGDEIEEAESNLKEFGATYDKITLKFAKGKDKDILPDDKGLRDLYKYADSMAYDEFNGKEIEDVIFTRKQEQAIIEQTNQGLQEQARIQERVAKEQKAASGTQMDDSRAEVEKTILSYEELCSIVERYNQLARKSVTEGEKLTKQEDKELSDITSRFAQTKTGGDPNKMADHAISWNSLVDPITRTVNTDRIAKYLGIEIPQAAEKAKQAIKEVDNTNVDPKVDLSTKNELQEIEKQAEKTDSALEELDLQKVSTDTKKDNKADVKATSSDNASLQEYQQLERLDAKLKEVKAAIEAKTQAFREEGSTVDSVVASEAAALEKLSSKLDEIVTKIKLVGDSFNQINSGSVDQVEGAIEAKQEKTPITTSGVDITSGKWALDSTLSTTNSILQGILTAVSGSESASQMADALNGAINELKAAAEAIKINANDIKDKSKDNAKDTSNGTKEKTFDEIKSDEISSFEKYKKAVESSIYVTDEFKSKLGELHSNLSNVKDAEGLKSWKESFSGFQKEFDRFESANQKVLTGQVNAIKNEAKAAMKGLDLDTLSSDPEKRAKQEEIAQGFKEIQIASEICASKIKSNQNAEIDALNATKKQLLENINAYRQQYGLLNGGKSGKNFGNTAVMQETTRYNKFQQYAKDEAAGYKDSATFNKALAQYTSAYERLIALRNRISAQSVRTDKDEQEFNDAKRAAAEYGKELDKLLSRSKRLEQNSYASSAIGGDINTEDASDRKQALTDFIVGMQGANESTMRFSKNYEECTFKMKNGDGTWTKMTATLDKTSNKMYATAGEVTKYGTAIGEFGAALKGEFLKLGRYMIASFGIEEVIQVVRQGITYVKEIDDALTDLKKVTNETDAGYARFLQTMSKTAGVVGSTVAELTTMAAEWARLNI